jgi:transposase
MRLSFVFALHLAYRWFCRLDLDDKVPHHSTVSVNRLGRFRESEILCHIFESVVASCMVARFVKGDGFAVGTSVTEANCQQLSRQSAGLNRCATSAACAGRISCWT